MPRTSTTIRWPGTRGAPATRAGGTTPPPTWGQDLGDVRAVVLERQMRKELVDETPQRPGVPTVDRRVDRRLLRHRDHRFGQEARAHAPSRRGSPCRASSRSIPVAATSRAAARRPRDFMRGCRNGENCATPDVDTAPSTFALLWPVSALPWNASRVRSRPCTGSARRRRVSLDRLGLRRRRTSAQPSQRDVVEILRRQVTARRFRQLEARRGTSGDIRSTWPSRRSTAANREHAQQRPPHRRRHRTESGRPAGRVG